MSALLQSLIHFTKSSKATKVLHGKSFKRLLYLLLYVGQIKLIKIQNGLQQPLKKRNLREPKASGLHPFSWDHTLNDLNYTCYCYVRSHT